MNITDYHILRADITTDLIDKVKVYLEEGWQPLGGTFTRSNEYFQTMVKYEGEKEISLDTLNLKTFPDLSHIPELSFDYEEEEEDEGEDKGSPELDPEATVGYEVFDETHFDKGVANYNERIDAIDARVTIYRRFDDMHCAQDWIHDVKTTVEDWREQPQKEES